MKFKNKTNVKLWLCLKVAVFGIIALFISCENESETIPTQITINVAGTDIKVTKMSGVTDAQVDEAVTFLSSWMSNWPEQAKNNFIGKIIEINLALSGTVTSHIGNVLTIAWDNRDFDEIIGYLGPNGLVQLLNKFNYSKNIEKITFFI